MIARALRDKKDKNNTLFLTQIVSGKIDLVVPTTAGARPDAVAPRRKAARRLKAATRGLLDAAQCDGQVLVWLLQSLYQIEGLRQAFDVALMTDLRTVCLEIAELHGTECGALPITGVI